MATEDAVSRHYSTGDMLGRIEKALRKVGVNPDAPGIDDLKAMDEFHTGGLEATSALLDQLTILPETRVVDMGCGIGGTARHILHRYGARVRGIDLTPAFVEVGQELNRRMHLDGALSLEVGSVTALPVEDASADLVTMFHVGMNVEDKVALFAEVGRILAPGGTFALFDVMRDDPTEELQFPLPWAEGAQTSQVDLPETYRAAASAAGLHLAAERSRRQFALDFFRRVFDRIEREGMPAMGIHLLMGESAPVKLRNYVANVEAHRIAPVEMIFRKEAG